MRRFFLTILAAAMTLCSCKKEQIAIMYSNQSAKIEAFVSKVLSSDEEAQAFYNDGVTRVIAHAQDRGEGDELTGRGKVTFEYAGYDFTNGTISAATMFSTNRKELAQSMNWNVADLDSMAPVTYALSDESLLEGLRLGLKGVKRGEYCTILFTGKYGYGDSFKAGVGRNAPLAFLVWVKDIEN